jgi:hypothetical protein
MLSRLRESARISALESILLPLCNERDEFDEFELMEEVLRIEQKSEKELFLTVDAINSRKVSLMFISLNKRLLVTHEKFDMFHSP